jgi:hypothetical protein
MMNEDREAELILEPEIIEILKTGHKIKAIKKLRELRNIGLKESKDIVDNYLDGSLDDSVDKSLNKSLNNSLNNYADKTIDESQSEEKIEARSAIKRAGEAKKTIFMAVGVFIIFIIYKQLTQ